MGHPLADIDVVTGDAGPPQLVCHAGPQAARGIDEDGVVHPVPPGRQPPVSRLCRIQAVAPLDVGDGAPVADDQGGIVVAKSGHVSAGYPAPGRRPGRTLLRALDGPQRDEGVRVGSREPPLNSYPVDVAVPSVQPGNTLGVLGLDQWGVGGAEGQRRPRRPILVVRPGKEALPAHRIAQHQKPNAGLSQRTLDDLECLVADARSLVHHKEQILVMEPL
ncbi:MAG: hypothetical protein BWY79_00016 [Actinobacteria bacterium ADurb.Bin444]|nr:MAG: hypothetical protein BWY79_00016 [Actinobacteria bacterium ADurb.Bin444]